MISGQWVGNFNGAGEGWGIINIEAKDGLLHCYAYLLNMKGDLPSSCSYFTLEDGQAEYKVENRPVQVINKHDFMVVPSFSTQDYITENFPGVVFPDTANLNIIFKEDELLVNVVTDIGTTVECKLSRQHVKGYKLTGTGLTWNEFKEYVSQVDYRKVAFRGQADSWPLRTSFHRNGRYDVQVYSNKDIPMLHRQLSNLTSHYFNLKDPEHNGAFFNLLQHHGYPTPLLDWSYSPYVASFFAFGKLNAKDIFESDKDRKVRIYLLEVEKWKVDFLQFYNIYDCRTHLSIGEYISLGNNRAMPQQALTTLTNIYDIEGYLYQWGGYTDKYLKAFDISVQEAPQVMRDLTMMGITYGSLFPGLDGTCQDLKKINFPETKFG